MIATELLNKAHNENWVNNNLPDKCASLIIADPPYYKTKGDFDFIWRNWDDYMYDLTKWVLECKRVLADNGTLLWYGKSETIARVQVHMDDHFNLINNLVWNKGDFSESKELKSFAPSTERILMYGSKVHDKTGAKYIEREYVSPLSPFKDIIREAREKQKLTVTEVAELGGFYGKVNHGGAVTNWEKGYNIPNPNDWEKLCIILDSLEGSYDHLSTQYERIKINQRAKFENKKRYFNNDLGLNEVLEFNNESTKTGMKYDHDTVKPETLSRALIITCSRPDSLLVVPFCGSGTECAMAVKEQRNFIGFDIENKYVKMTNSRCKPYLTQKNLFHES